MKTSRSRSPLRLLLCGALLAVVIVAALLRRPAPSAPLSPTKTVVLLLAPGASLADWSDSSRAPTLAALMQTCPHGVFPTRTDESPLALRDPLLSGARMIATGDRTLPHLPPTLADILGKSGIKAVTLTNGDEAAGAVVGQRRPDPLMIDSIPWAAPEPGFPDGWMTDPIPFSEAIHNAATRTDIGADATVPVENAPKLIVVTFDDLYRADRYALLALAKTTRAQRREALARLDRVVDALTSPTSPSQLGDSVCLMLVSPVPSSDALGRGERLGPVLLWTVAGASPGRLLASPSTRETPGLVAGTDLAATIAAQLGRPPSLQRIGAGRAARLVPDDGRLPKRIRVYDAQARALTLLIYVPWILAGLLIAGMLAAPRYPHAAFALCASTALYPLSLLISSNCVTLLSPAALYLLAAIPCLILGAAIAMRLVPKRRYRNLFGGIALATSVFLIGDILSGSDLLARTPLSYSVMEAARFYGIGNEGAGVLVGASLLTVAVLFGGVAACEYPAIIAWGAAICLTLGLPMLGAKAGSLLGALVAFGVLVVVSRALRSKQKPSAASVGVAAGSALLLFVAYALWDGSRGPDVRSHVGEAVAAAHRYGFGALLGIEKRKSAMDLHLLTTSPWAALLLVEAGLCLYLWQRNFSKFPLSDRSALIALFVAAATLLVANDAGVVGAATCLLFAVPLTLLPDLK